MAMPFTGNVVWNHIAESARDMNVDAATILRQIATCPTVVEAVQGVLDSRDETDFDIPGGDPADSVIATLADVLTRTPNGEPTQPLY